MVGGVLSCVGLLLDGHWSRMPDPRPRGQQQQQPSVRTGVNGMTFTGVELHHYARRSDDALARRSRELHLTGQHRHPRSLVDLMVLKALPRGDRQGDRACIVGRGEDPRSMRPRARLLTFQLLFTGVPPRIGVQTHLPACGGGRLLAGFVAARSGEPSASHGIVVPLAVRAVDEGQRSRRA